MKKILFTVLIFLALSNITFAKEYQSSYGFSIEVPEHWLVLTPNELKNNPDLFDFENADFGGMDKTLLKQHINEIKTGNVEVFFNQNTSDIEFSDNINIIKQIGRIPVNRNETSKVCNDFEGQLSQSFGRKINLYQCKTVTIKNNHFFISESDGFIQGTKNIQYQFNKSPNVLIIITLTSKNKTIDIIRNEFDDMINSIQFK